MRILKITLLMILLALTIVVSAQSNECPAMVQEAVAATGNICADVGRNQACYGNISIDTQLSDDALAFDKEGDMVDLTSVESMTLSPLDAGTGAWGVALLSVQANIPDTVPGQNVSFLIFGDVEITNAGSAMEAFYFKGGIGDAGCSEAANGILIQTPQGVGEIELVANDVKITLGSTAFLTAQPEENMTVALLEGSGSVEAEDVTQPLEVGMQVSIPMDEDLSADGPPSEPEPIPDTVAPLLTTVHEAEDDTEATAGDGDAALAGEDIVPLSGNWQFAMGNAVTSAGCPAQMAQAMQQTFNTSEVTYVEFGDSFDLQAMMEANSAEPMPAGFTYDHPSPNIYTMHFGQEGVVMNWEWRILSETTIEGGFTVDMTDAGLSCVISVDFSSDHQG